MDIYPFLLLLFAVNYAIAAKILLLPFDHKGHVNFFTVAAKELQSRGHEVVVLAQHRNKHIVEKANVPHILNYGKTQSPIEDYDKLSNVLFKSGLSQVRNLMSFSSSMGETILEMCYEVMQSETIMNSLKKQKFDIALVDGVDFTRCWYVIPYKLDIPYITLTARHDPWATGLPALPSVEGFYGFKIMSKDSGYRDIFMNLAIYLGTYLMSPPPIFKDSQIKELAPEKPKTTYHDLFKGSEVFLVNYDNTCFDYPRVGGPHYHFIGGMAASPAKPLPKEFEDFVSKASDGLIVVSFGSLVKQAPREMLDKMLAAFRLIPQRVVMRYDGQVDDVPSNVMLAKWLPQNDLLGHKKTRLFIAHGGNNGQMEGLYHGLPMIVMPIVEDQFYSAWRAVDKKFGLSLNPMDFTIDELRAAIQEVLSNPVYTQNMKKCSAISKDFPSAHENIDFWVRHVLKFGGGDHLTPISMDMPLYQVFMLDVVLIILVLDVVMCYALYLCCKSICRRWRSRKQKEKMN